jgi:hypothetical protein
MQCHYAIPYASAAANANTDPVTSRRIAAPVNWVGLALVFVPVPAAVAFEPVIVEVPVAVLVIVLPPLVET